MDKRKLFEELHKFINYRIKETERKSSIHFNKDPESFQAGYCVGSKIACLDIKEFLAELEDRSYIFQRCRMIEKKI